MKPLKIKKLAVNICLVLCVFFFSLALPVYASENAANTNKVSTRIDSSALTAEQRASYIRDARLIRHTYETQLFTLPAKKSGHYGLRMYRQTLDNKYKAAIWSDMARVVSRLNQFTTEIYTPEQIKAYTQMRLKSYLKKVNKKRSQLRYQATKSMPEYLYLVAALGSMARINEYGLRHREDKKIRDVIRRYDFKKYAMNEVMIKAWAAQLANQVYWLRQLGEQDVVDDFITTFRRVYPDAQDAELSVFQFANKIYGLTHIIIAASEYYQIPINEKNYQWIYDYYRENIDTIIARAKEDIIAEVGINFLLAGLENDPVVRKTRQAIQQAINRKHGLVPSTTGSVDLLKGEHRNVLAIMLLDWKGLHKAPTIQQQPDMFSSIPYGLIAK